MSVLAEIQISLQSALHTIQGEPLLSSFPPKQLDGGILPLARQPKLLSATPASRIPPPEPPAPPMPPEPEKNPPKPPTPNVVDTLDPPPKPPTPIVVLPPSN